MGPRKAWIDLFWLDLKQNNKTRKWSQLSMLLLKVGCMLELFKFFLWLVALPTIHLGSPTNPQIMATWFFHFNWFFLISVPLLHSSVVSQAGSGSVRNGFSFLRLRPREKKKNIFSLVVLKCPGKNRLWIGIPRDGYQRCRKHQKTHLKYTGQIKMTCLLNKYSYNI